MTRAASDPRMVICLGEALIDRLGPPDGDVKDGPWVDYLGGAPANVASALARLGTPTALCARLGEDKPGGRFQELFCDRGVQTDGVQSDPERPTRVVLVSRDRTGERRFGGFAGDRGLGFADQALRSEELQPVLKSLLLGAAYLLLGTIPMASVHSSRAHELAMAMAIEAGVPIAMDVNWRPTFWPCSSAQARHQILRVLPEATLLKLAAEEADWLFGSHDPAEVAVALAEACSRGGIAEGSVHSHVSSSRLVVMTDGGRPVLWSTGALHGECPALEVPVVDTTGAGDAFTAGLLHKLANEPPETRVMSQDRLEGAVRFATACGALTCSGEGAIDPQPGDSSVRAFLQGG